MSSNIYVWNVWNEMFVGLMCTYFCCQIWDHTWSGGPGSPRCSRYLQYLQNSLSSTFIQCTYTIQGILLYILYWSKNQIPSPTTALDLSIVTPSKPFLPSYFCPFCLYFTLLTSVLPLCFLCLSLSSTLSGFCSLAPLHIYSPKWHCPMTISPGALFSINGPLVTISV